MIKTLGLTHLALTVSDMERSFQFYHDVFGMLAVYREKSFHQVQTPGAHDILVLEEGTENVGRSGGIKHFGFRLTDARDIDRAAASIERAGG
jgi:catechol 2,3-dioxygenase-like lactoylglutathione lyase family enzyme